MKEIEQNLKGKWRCKLIIEPFKIFASNYIYLHVRCRRLMSPIYVQLSIFKIIVSLKLLRFQRNIPCPNKFTLSYQKFEIA